MGVAEPGSAGGDEPSVPFISAQIWLKPFDLGVSQQLTITLPEYTLTGQFIANIDLRHLSGTRESWLRLNRSFVTRLRRHFLHWRVVREDEREELWREAVDRLTAKSVVDA